MNAPSHTPPVVRTTCPYCGVGCGVLASPDGRGGAMISGDPEHPANFGRLCSKGAALGETLDLDGRLLHPMARREDGTLARIGWTDALDRVAQGFAAIIERDGPDAVAFYLSGQLLTEDYYVANKLMKGFIGSANVDTNSRLCMSSSVAGHRRAFGADTVPGVYADLDEADLIVLVGSNAAWCHPVLFQRMVANKRERGAKLVVIDPRRTATAEDADLFLPVAPGTDTALFCGLLVHLAERGALDTSYIAAHTTGFAEALARAREIADGAEATARATGLARADVEAFFSLFAATPRALTCFSQGVNQSAQGTDKVDAIINCHLATGRIGKPGAGPFSLTGQPNAMGGREVGGLANQLAAHMGFASEDIDRVRRFWRALRIVGHEGLTAVPMFDAIGRGEIKALWVMGTNPAVSLPRAGAVREALAKLELFVVSENVVSNDTVNAGAHLVLPAAAWGEKDGTVTNSERRISRQRPFLPLPGEAKPDWWMVTEVARRLGFAAAFSYRSAADVFREHAALSGFENDGRRDFDLAGLATLDDAQFDALAPIQWPVPTSETRTAAVPPTTTKGKASAFSAAMLAPQRDEAKRFFATGGYFTPDGKARFIVPEFPRPKEDVTDAFPLRLNTGRIRDQWHTMTRSGKSPRLGGHMPEPFVQVSAVDAAAAQLVDGGFARVSTAHGACGLKVVVDPGQRPGSVFAPIHWSDETAASARVGELVAAHVDRYSFQPEAKATPVAIAPVTFASRGFALTRAPVAWPDGTWWSRVAVGGGCGYLLATNTAPEEWQAFARALFGPTHECAEYLDGPRGIFRLAAFCDGRLDGALFVGPAEAAPGWDAARALFEAETVTEADRRVMLSGRTADGLANCGPVVCACFGVHLESIRTAITTQALADVDQIGAALRAGTNCGSCRPELKRIIGEHAHSH